MPNHTTGCRAQLDFFLIFSERIVIGYGGVTASIRLRRTSWSFCDAVVPQISSHKLRPSNPPALFHSKSKPTDYATGEPHEKRGGSVLERTSSSLEFQRCFRALFRWRPQTGANTQRWALEFARWCFLVKIDRVDQRTAPFVWYPSIRLIAWWLRWHGVHLSNAWHPQWCHERWRISNYHYFERNSIHFFPPPGKVEFLSILFLSASATFYPVFFAFLSLPGNTASLKRFWATAGRRSAEGGTNKHIALCQPIFAVAHGAFAPKTLPHHAGGRGDERCQWLVSFSPPFLPQSTLLWYLRPLLLPLFLVVVLCPRPDWAIWISWRKFISFVEISNLSLSFRACFFTSERALHTIFDQI